jgi:hypothetical protein
MRQQRAQKGAMHHVAQTEVRGATYAGGSQLESWAVDRLSLLMRCHVI